MHRTLLKRSLFGLFALFLFGCSAQQRSQTPPSDVLPPTEEASMPKTASLPDLGPAPELTNDIWLNVDSPLRLEDLRGKVIILEMWTFGCINCKNVIPSLKEWHSKYADQGLVIIGNHYPEFSYERDLENVKKAVADYGIEYAVAQDNDGVTWRAYKNRYWPALYLIDKQGHIRYVHFGEGKYQETEENIQALLAEEYTQ
ncbi:MAG TPA: redoxin domain-containing protein [Anaerolineales bacterium]|nr:redoxin domain-containing protein [Anaerolineales bacterium]